MYYVLVLILLVPVNGQPMVAKQEIQVPSLAACEAGRARAAGPNVLSSFCLERT
jgi:hypothetical protein